MGIPIILRTRVLNTANFKLNQSGERDISIKLLQLLQFMIPLSIKQNIAIGK